ncbi:MAG: DUF3883 domain-containing protein [Planctomycetaceae bacterium]
MDRYAGIDGIADIAGGGSYVEDHGFGHEVFNFEAFSGRVFGYVQPSGHGRPYNERAIRFEKHFSGILKDEDSIPGILAVWIARAPTGGTFVVGWYRDAVLYRKWQESPVGAPRLLPNGESAGYFVTATSGNSVLLPPKDRVLRLPPRTTGGPGQSNVWYADDPEVHGKIRQNVLEFVAKWQESNWRKENVSGTPRQPDPFRRQQIERAAVEYVTRHFTAGGYVVDSKETDNVGWDLEATRGREMLRLEVKGLSASAICVELTPNEYAKMREHRDSWRLCVVTSALTHPALAIFAWSSETGEWEDQRDRRLGVTERIAARCSIKAGK